MLNPQSTYRIQFHSNFTFKELEEIVPYLRQLGIGAIYASPIFMSVPGSMHGYDGVDPNRINPELGTLNDLKRIAKKLKEAGISWIQDIVPNHMGFHHLNTWLMDVLRNGEKSVYRNHFDIISKDLEADPLMAPFLGAELDSVIENKELSLVKKDSEDFLKYHDSLWPLRNGTNLSLPLKEIVNQQYYRLCHYKESHRQINYRRFFTVNSLICININNDVVFEQYHQLTKELLDQGLIQGLRIDHVDGIFDPSAYLNKLRQLCGTEVYIVVEKILEPGETLPANWPVQGTTGYDYLGLANQLFTNQKAEKKFNKFYSNLGHFNRPVTLQIQRKKRDFLNNYMQGELQNLTDLFLLPEDPKRPIVQSALWKQLISEFLIACPVYRFYESSLPLSETESAILNDIFESINMLPAVSALVPYFRANLFHSGGQFFLRLMQFTGPLMAKGVEDTLMYTFSRFIGNNEVGDSPELFGITAADFHDQIKERQTLWPLAMNTTATHDTKRGEDARARLNVLTDLKNEWLLEVTAWQKANLDIKKSGHPDNNDEYFIYQTLIATYPDTAEEQITYLERLTEYIEKALREAKTRSNWEEPDERYEADCKQFIASLLDQKREFWQTFLRFHEKVSALGKINSLAALILKHACPGVPDTYQGTEFWDLSMVDPDNRRPVDYHARIALLNELEKDILELPELWRTSATGKIKLCFLSRLLQLRKQYPDVFAKGSYTPLSIEGKFAANVVAFVRRYKNDCLIFAVPINVTEVLESEHTKIGIEDWQDTRIILPEHLNTTYADQLRESKIAVSDGLLLNDLFKSLPFAVLHAKLPEQTRGAGVLMHVSSLPSGYGIGDFGPSASSFISFLAASGQKYWQVLPMNPLAKQQSFSPYSATSVMAGNVLLISPDLLYQEGLLSQGDLDAHTRKTKRKVSFEKVELLKLELLSTAYKNFRKSSDQSAFKLFCDTEAQWLNDYSAYVVLKNLHTGTPWFEWPKALRQRSATQLKTFQVKYQAEIDEVKWQQFVFFKQWKSLRQQAAVQNIQIIGDLPFYAALDSADVWANPRLFNIDGDGKVLGIAGVPPDYFNADGQLWGMPVYKWKEMGRQKYQWWIKRIAKNIEMYDLIRLDHFRAFAAYWEVPADSDSAKAGTWIAGPGTRFFQALTKHFGTRLPLIAEDLGEITPDVIELRDQFNLPGMKVLQFAFGEDLSTSVHAPHNFKSADCLVYTGTHDNNTTLGWYEDEADAATKQRVANYLNTKLNNKNVVKNLIRAAYSSVANIAIIPIQDILNKDSGARMNTPASVDGNWMWRLRNSDFDSDTQRRLLQLARLYGRY
ncbi:MAG: malto-oligosyltrehalose synthase [Bacteroidota bacterium]